MNKQGTKIEYRGYVVSQSSCNHHVMITKNGHMVFHSQCDKPKTEQELRETVDFYIEFTESDMFDKAWGDNRAQNH